MKTRPSDQNLLYRQKCRMSALCGCIRSPKLLRCSSLSRSDNQDAQSPFRSQPPSRSLHLDRKVEKNSHCAVIVRLDRATPDPLKNSKSHFRFSRFLFVTISLQFSFYSVSHRPVHLVALQDGALQHGHATKTEASHSESYPRHHRPCSCNISPCTRTCLRAARKKVCRGT